MKENIDKYRTAYEKFLRVHNNTSDKQVWQIYDHITNEIFNDVYEEACKDLNNIEDYIIQSEFFS